MQVGACASVCVHVCVHVCVPLCVNMLSASAAGPFYTWSHLISHYLIFIKYIFHRNISLISVENLQKYF